MTLKELKEAIILNDIPSDLIIFLCSENHFLAQQYTKEIFLRRDLTLNTISSLSDLKQNSALSLVFNNDINLNVLVLDSEAEFTEVFPDYQVFTNTIIICNKINKKVLPLVEDYIVEIPKLKDWQIKAYMKLYCTGLYDFEYDWLYNITNGDVYRITNELNKLLIFNEADRHNLLVQLQTDASTDLYRQDILSLSNAILKNDTHTILEYLRHQSIVEFDPIALTNILLGNFKKILLVTGNTGVDPITLGFTKQQVYIIRREYAGYSVKKLLKVIDFLSGIDMRLKNNKLDMPATLLLNYIICNVLKLGTFYE